MRAWDHEWRQERKKLTPTSWKHEKWLRPLVISLPPPPSLSHHPCLPPGYPDQRRSHSGAASLAVAADHGNTMLALETHKSWPVGTVMETAFTPTICWWNWQRTSPCLLLCLLALEQPQFLSGTVRLLPTDLLQGRCHWQVLCVSSL